MSLKEKVASVLEALADAWEERSTEPAASAVSATEDPVVKIATAYREATGEDLSDELRGRLTNDPALQEMVTKVAKASPQRPTPLGEAADVTSEGSSVTKSKEAAYREAEERFARGIIRLGQS